MTISDLIYNLSIWQWLGIFWAQLVFNFLIIRCFETACEYLYSFFTRNDRQDLIEMLINDMKEVDKDNDDINTQDKSE